ncbi:hypothetical protein N7527_012197 [Penicillium freii]|nr:hypothetical protein N7527_012197 [Penicillium freii]
MKDQGVSPNSQRWMATAGAGPTTQPLILTGLSLFWNQEPKRDLLLWNPLLRYLETPLVVTVVYYHWEVLWQMYVAALGVKSRQIHSAVRESMTPNYVLPGVSAAIRPGVSGSQLRR